MHGKQSAGRILENFCHWQRADMKPSHVKYDNAVLVTRFVPIPLPRD